MNAFSNFIAQGPARGPGGRVRHMPGEEGIWMFVLGDALMFTLLFGLYLVYRSENVELFRQSQAHLAQGYGLLNTVFMLTSSWCVAMAVHAARLRNGTATQVLLALALACGAAFGVVKVFEYSEKISAGITLTSNDFFMYYFMLTGIHMVHVLIAMGVLAYLVYVTRGGSYTAETVRSLENGATFWHLVDLLWIVLFALLYLVR